MLHKHASELRRMRDPEHRALIPLVEASLALMRLSCENFFSLAAVGARVYMGLYKEKLERFSK